MTLTIRVTGIITDLLLPRLPRVQGPEGPEVGCATPESLLKELAVAAPCLVICLRFIGFLGRQQVRHVTPRESCFELELGSLAVITKQRRDVSLS